MNFLATRPLKASLRTGIALISLIACIGTPARAAEATLIDSSSLGRLQEEAARPFRRILESAQLQKKKTPVTAVAAVVEVRKTKLAQPSPVIAMSAAHANAVNVRDDTLHASIARINSVPAEPQQRSMAAALPAPAQMPLLDGGGDGEPVKTASGAGRVAAAPVQPLASSRPADASRFSSASRERGG